MEAKRKTRERCLEPVRRLAGHHRRERPDRGGGDGDLGRCVPADDPIEEKRRERREQGRQREGRVDRRDEIGREHPVERSDQEDVERLEAVCRVEPVEAWTLPVGDALRDLERVEAVVVEKTVLGENGKILPDHGHVENEGRAQQADGDQPLGERGHLIFSQ